MHWGLARQIPVQESLGQLEGKDQACAAFYCCSHFLFDKQSLHLAFSLVVLEHLESCTNLIFPYPLPHSLASTVFSFLVAHHFLTGQISLPATETLVSLDSLYCSASVV